MHAVCQGVYVTATPPHHEQLVRCSAGFAWAGRPREGAGERLDHFARIGPGRPSPATL